MDLTVKLKTKIGEFTDNQNYYDTLQILVLHCIQSEIIMKIFMVNKNKLARVDPATDRLAGAQIHR